jgi:hypothetical protein
MPVANILEKLIAPIYSWYCSQTGLMGLHEFTRFNSDFDIFPTLLSNSTIVSIFGSVCRLTKNGDTYIDQESFILSIKICGVTAVYTPIDPPYKEKVSELLR